MSEMRKPERRRFQFGMRKLVLWTAVAALGLGLLSTIGVHDVGLVVPPIWFATVCFVRWGFGSVWAAVASVIAGMLAFLLSFQLLLASHDIMFAGPLVVVGGCVGFHIFVLAEFASWTVNWLDRIGRSDG